MTEITTLNKLSCAEKELRTRRVVYARWVANGNMEAETAAHEIACMKAIVEDYRAQIERETERQKLRLNLEAVTCDTAS